MQKSKFQLAIALKLCAIGLCAVLALRGRPPAGAQQTEISGTNGLSVEDQLQDQAIASLRESADKSETREERIKDDTDRDIRDLRDDLNASRIETRGEFGGIGLLYGGGLLADWRRRKGGASE